MPKQLSFGEEARVRLKNGIDKLANAVKATMGPKGRYVVLDKKFGAPVVTNDGVTIAKEIELEDAFENIGARLVREVASKTNDVAGDGTTTATVLAQALLTEGLRNVASGVNPVYLHRGIRKAGDAVVNELRRIAKQVKDADIAQIASISAGDKEIGDIVAKAVQEVGKDGIVTVEAGKTATVEFEVVRGMQFNRGYISPYFVTDQERAEAVLDNPAIVILNRKVSAVNELVPLLEKLLSQSGGNTSFLLIAEDVEGEALATLVLNKMQGRVKCAAVKAPGFGDQRLGLLEDIAVLTGGEVITDAAGMKLDNIDVSVLGKAKRVVVRKDQTMIVDGLGDKEAINKRVETIKNQITMYASEYDIEQLQGRIAKLTGGVAVIHVGASTETEMRAKKFKIEDATNATKAGIEEGIVPGGGVALLRASSVLSRLSLDNPEEQVGVSLVQRALEQPLRQIAQNAGIEGSVAINQVKSVQDLNYGLNAEDGSYGDLLELGVIDPVKVVRSALENAVSIAGLILTTEVAVTDIPSKNSDENSMGQL